MISVGISSSIHFALLTLAIFFLQHTSSLATKKSWIVYLGTHSHGLDASELDAKIATQSHYKLLGSILGSQEKVQESMQYNYNKYINGFVAKLTDDEIERIKKSPSVVSVFENERLRLHTTRSWEFLGLEQNNTTPSYSLWEKTRYGDGIIIGNIDTGVWPESESFIDTNFGPVPPKWKGACMTGLDPTFRCNKKLIGARYFKIESNEMTDLSNSNKAVSISPRDTWGHGTHTLSTAGGNFVKGASAFGLGYGVAKGGSSNARVAAYKVCWHSGCLAANILAAFEAAIGDGVDVLSVSVGNDPKPYKEDALAIGSFHALRHGIAVVAACGNNGPLPGIMNTAPWMFTVGASTSDRNFFNKIFLGNSTLHFKGASAGFEKMLPRRYFHPLIDGASASINSSSIDMARGCRKDSLDPSKVRNKIVVCHRRGLTIPSSMSYVVRTAGGIGMIAINDDAFGGDDVRAEVHGIPASHLHYKDGQALMDYMDKTLNPTAYITNVKTELGIKPAPMVADFSSRGPSELYPQILKPDIIAPGVNIIAAYTGAHGPSGGNDTRKVRFTLDSGTSMSCPHVAGIVGLLKALHPEWSPAAIRSALMTTANAYDNENKPLLDYNGTQATPFAYGAGHINPNAAADPGLIYNLTENDYLDFLCSVDKPFTKDDLKIFTPNPYKCANTKTILDFNYPSITVTNFTTSATFTRTLTNVGNPGTYKVKVIAPPAVNVKVVPSILKFSYIGEVLMYAMELKKNEEKHKEPGYVFGSLAWSDGTHNVRSPLVVQIV